MEKGSEGDNSFGIAGVIFGVLSILFAIIIIVGPILGIIGLVFSISQSRKKKNNWSTAGMILSSIGIILGIILIILMLAFIAWVGNIFGCLQDPNKVGCESMKAQIEQMQQQAGEQIAANMQTQYSQNPGFANTGG